MTARSRNKVRPAGRKRRGDLQNHTDARLRALTENLTDSITVVDQAGTILYDNPTVHSILGNTSQELVGRNAFELVHTDDLSLTRRLFRELLRKPGTTRTVELRLRHRDGSWRAVEVIGKNLLANPAVAGIVLNARDITERKQTAEALAAERNLLRTLIDLLPDAIYVKDLRSRFLLANAAVARVMGAANPADLLGKTDKDFYPQALAAQYGADERKIIRTGQPLLHKEEPRTNADGTASHILTTKVPLRDAQGKITGLVGIGRDITDRKQAEAALAHERDLLQSVMNSAGRAHLVYLDRDFNFVRVNETYAATCGYRPEAMIGKNHFALYPNAENEAIFRRVRATGQPFEVRDKPFEFPGHPERGVTYWDWTLIPVKDIAGQVTGLIFSLFETTARVQAEAALKRTTNTLAEAQRIAHLGSFEYVAATRTTVWSEEEYRIYGLDPARPSPSYDVLLQKCIHPADRVLLRETFTKAMQRRSIYELEHRIVQPDGSVRWVYDRAQPYFDGQGKLVRYVGVTLDITGRKQAEAALQADRDGAQRLAELGMLFAREGNLKPALTAVVDAAIAITGADFGNIQLLDPANGDLKIAVQRGFPKWWLDFWDDVSKGKGVCGTALARGRRVIVEDVTKSKIFTGKLALKMQLKAGVRAVQSTPLVSGSGKVLGMFSTHYKTPRRPDERALPLLDLLARQAAGLLERAQIEQALRETSDFLQETERIGKVGGWEFDIDTGKVTWTDEVYRIHEVDLDYQPTVEKGVAFYAPESRSVIERAVRRAVQFGEPYDVELALVTAKGNRRWVQAIGKVDLAHRRVYGFFQDITARKQAEEKLQQLNETLEQRVAERTAALQESETRFRTIFDTAADGMFLHDRKSGRIVLANKACLDLLGYTLPELITLVFDELHPKEELTAIRARLAAMRRSHAEHRAEVRFKRKDGNLVDTELQYNTVQLHGQDYVLVMLRDISERKRLQTEVERVSEMERQRLGRDLHDGLSQHLAAMAMLGDALAAALGRQGIAQATQAAQLAQRAREATKITHDLSRGLYPASLQVTGLSTALVELAALVQKLFPIQCQFHNGNGWRLADPNVERQLFRIAQEAAFNAAKHSGGRHIWITFRQSKHWLTLSIKDDGIGAFPAKLAASGMGLNIMRYRADLIGAILTIDAKRGRGTTVTCKLRNHSL